MLLWNIQARLLVNQAKIKKQLGLSKRIITISEKEKRNILRNYLNKEINKFNLAFRNWLEFSKNSKELVFTGQKSIPKIQKIKTQKKREFKKLKKEKFKIVYKNNVKPRFRFVPREEYLSYLILKTAERSKTK